MLFVRFTLLHDSAFKLVAFIFTVDFTITAGHKTNTASVVAGVLVKGASAEAYSLDFSSTREAAKVIGHLPVVVSKYKAGEF